MSATLHVLGAGTILPRDGYSAAGYALRPAPGAPVTLLDCGPGSVGRLAGAGIAVEEVERVVLSHYHLDHCLDLFALAMARRNPRLGTLPVLGVHGPPGLRRWLDGASSLLGKEGPAAPLVIAEESLAADGRARFTAGGMTFTGAPTGHTEHALAWRVDFADGTSLTYTGDTGETPAVAALARGTDLLLAECSFAEAEADPRHLTPQGAGRMARAAGARRLVLTHFYPGLDPAAARDGAARLFDGPIEIARDGTVHTPGGNRIMGR